MEQRKTTRIHRPTILFHEKETTGNSMKIGGLQKTSLLDYPDHISAIIWTMGCNFHCPFCYNTEIVNKTAQSISEKEILNFLHSREGLLEALVITGGEPLLQNDLEPFINRVKSMGFLIKIDTNGAFPNRLKPLLEKKLVDYIAMDIKAPPEKYHRLIGSKVEITDINQSITLIKELALDYEFRTTFVPTYLEKQDIVQIATWLKGAKRFYLQQYKHDAPHLLSSIQKIKPYAKKYILETLDQIKPFFNECHARGL
jgi:pyruvate formate lyase activating enzyme